MPSPFPGMDPYLEAPDLYPDVHQGLAYALREQLTPEIQPRYVALIYHHIEIDRVEPGAHVGADVAVVKTRSDEPTGRPRASLGVQPAPVRLRLPQSLPVKHFRLEVVEARSRRLVTVVEILSRANKLPGKDRRAYLKKREGYLSSDVHFLEIDLLRAGRRAAVGPDEPRSPYRVLLSRAGSPREAELWPLGLRDPLPVVPLPLLEPDPDVALGVGAALARVYAGAGYEALIDYGAPPPPPPLAEDEAAWVRERVEAARRRG